MYKVSVVVVVYNTEKFLGECFDSIFNQTLDEVEVVVVDNASEEGTRIALEEKLKGHTNVVHRRMEQNVGGAAGATAGIGMASGEYLYIMDSDDILPENALEVLYNAITKENCDVAVGRAVSLINGKISTLRFSIDEITWAKELITDSLEKNPQLIVAPFFWGKLYRRSFIVENNIYMKDGVINADRYMTTKALMLSSRTVVIRDITCIWRRHTSKSGTKSVTMTSKELFSIRDRMQSLVDTAMLFPEGELRQYALISNLARVFLPVRSLKNEEIRPEYARLIEEYLALTDENKMIESTVLPVRYKVYAYLARRKRYDDIAPLPNVISPRIKSTADGTFETYPGLHDVPKEVLRVRTVGKWSRVCSCVENGELKVRCFVADTSLCPPESTALFVSETVNGAVYECARPVSRYKTDENVGVMEFSVRLSEESISLLMKKKKYMMLFLESRSGDTVFRTEIPLSSAVLESLYCLLTEKNGLAKPKTAARRNVLLRKLAPIRQLWEKVKSHL